MQHRTFRKFAVFLSLFVLAVFISGCKKQVAATPPAPAPAPPAAQPTVTMNASPSTINPGQTATLSWSSTNATDLDIQPGVGKVAPQGATPVNPAQTTTYTITATGAGGNATATATVEVSAAPEAAAPPAQPNLSDLFSQNVKDAY